MTCDAYHMTDPRADGLGVSTCIELALKNAGIERDEVRFGVRLPSLMEEVFSTMQCHTFLCA